MLGLKSSPGLTRFALIHGVSRASLVAVLKTVFSHHLEVLNEAKAVADQRGILHLRQGQDEIRLTVQTVDFPQLSRVQLPQGALGVLESVPKNPTKLQLLVSVPRRFNRSAMVL